MCTGVCSEGSFEPRLLFGLQLLAGTFALHVNEDTLWHQDLEGGIFSDVLC